MTQPDFFIAYAGPDREVAERLHASLAPAATFLDTRSLGGGDDLSKLPRTKARVLVVLFSTASVAGHYLLAEVTAAIKRMREDPGAFRIVPVRLDGADLAPYGLEHVPPLDARRGMDLVVQELRSVLEKLKRLATIPPADVAVLAVTEELGAVQAAVARRLRNTTGVRAVHEVDAARSGAPEGAIVVVLVGLRTGGVHHLEDAVPADARLCWRIAKPDADGPGEAEFEAGRRLRKRVRECIEGADDAQIVVQRAVLDHLATRIADEPPVVGIASWERAYLRGRCNGSWEELPSFLTRRDAPGGSVLQRSALYVPLSAARGRWFRDAEGRTIVVPAKARREPSEEESDPLLEAVALHPDLRCVAIRGPAGCGKTVLVHHLAVTLARPHLAGSGGLIPVVLKASDIRGRGVGAVVEACRTELAAGSGEAIEAGPIRAGLAEGKYILLVDALDEVPGEVARGAVLNALQETAAQGWPLRIVLTTRPAAYAGADPGPPFDVVDVAPLDADAAAAILHNWCAARGHPANYSDELRGVLDGVAERSGAAERLDANPLLLTMAMVVYAEHGSLPDDLASLFDELITYLCKTRAPSGQHVRYREALQALCTAIQSAKGARELDRRRAEDALCAWDRSLDRQTAWTLVDALARDTSLVEILGPPFRVRVWHKTFQEYLAACEIVARAGSDAAAVDALFDGRIDDPAWLKSLELVVGSLYQQGSPRAVRALERLRAHALGTDGVDRHAKPWNVWWLLVAGLAEYKKHLRSDALAGVAHEVVAAYEAEGLDWPLEARIAILEALGRLGDPRLKLRQLWVEIPGGERVLGDEEDEQPRRRLIGRFRIAWRPVTVEDFGRFVDENGYADDRWWPTRVPDEAAEAWAEARRYGAPGGWAGQRRHPGRPVVEVSWFEARAFCRWAQARGWASEGWTVDIPTSDEWETAARGDDGRPFPWGSEAPEEGDFANYDAGGSRGELVGAPSPVGAFPRGRNRRWTDPDGEPRPIADLVGNVWEWCGTEWERRDAARVDTSDVGVDSLGVADRVVRGGSWFNVTGGLRCAYRLGVEPGDRSVDLGFRVVSRPPLAS